MPGLENGGGVNQVRQDAQPPHQKPDTKLPETNYQKFYGRMVHTLKKFMGVFTYLTKDKPTSAQTFKVYETLTKGQQFHDGYHKALHNYKVASAMQLHKLASVNEKEINGHAEIVIGAGIKMSSTEAVRKITETLKLTPTNLCYKFLAKGKKLPPGYLERALVPYFEEELMIQYGLDIEDARLIIKTLTNQTGLKKTEDITFERILELKNAIRWKMAPDTPASPAVDAQHHPFNPDTPALTRSSSRNSQKEPLQTG